MIAYDGGGVSETHDLGTVSPLSSSSSNVAPETLASLLDEVVAMADSQRSLVIGLAHLDDPALGRVGKAARNIRQQIDQGLSADQAIANLSGEYGPGLRVAMSTLAETGSTRPIDALAASIRRAQHDRQQARAATWNPTVHVLLSVLITAWVVPHMIVMMADSPIAGPGRSSRWLDLSQFMVERVWIAPLVGLFAAVVFGWVVNRGPSRHKSSHHVMRREATFCRWLALMVGCHADAPTSVEAAAEASFATRHGVADRVDSWRGLVDRMRQGGTGDAFLQVPHEVGSATAQCVMDLAAGNRNSASITEDLQHLAALLDRRADECQRWWVGTVPRLASCGMVAAMIATVLFAAIAPLVDELIEIAR